MSSSPCVVDPTRECLGLSETKRLEEALDALRKKNSETHQRLWDEIHAIKESEAGQRVQYQHIIEKLTAIQAKVDNLELKPAKRYEDIVKQIISLLIAAVVGMIFGKIFI